MSANIPFEIQEEIIRKVVSVKALIRFRTLSKQWKSLIDSSEFIGDHSINQTQPHHLLVSHVVASERKFVSIADDDSFPQHKFSPTFTPAFDDLVYSRIIGCSHGLVCLFGDNQDRNSQIVVWNPSIRKSVSIVLLRLPFTKLGFGVCPKTSDPKIVKITGKTSMNLKAEVFRLSSGAWRSVSMNLSYNSIKRLSNQVVIDGAIYWIAVVETINDGPASIKLLSFNLTSEEFIQSDLPGNLARESALTRYRGLSKLKESLVVLNYFISDDRKLGCDVWMMLKNNVQSPSFTKLFDVKVNISDGFCAIIGFRKTGQPIMKQSLSFCEGSLKIKLGVYEFSSKQINNIGIYTSHIDTTFYTESLLLLNHTGSLS